MLYCWHILSFHRDIAMGGRLRSSLCLWILLGRCIDQDPRNLCFERIPAVFATPDQGWAVRECDHCDQKKKSFPSRVTMSSIVPNCFVNSRSRVKPLVKGSPLFAIGHGIFGPSSGTLPLITSGVCSKVVSYNQQPVMLLSSAPVHRGNSGGVLITTDGHFAGLVTGKQAVVVCVLKEFLCILILTHCQYHRQRQNLHRSNHHAPQLCNPIRGPHRRRERVSGGWES